MTGLHSKQHTKAALAEQITLDRMTAQDSSVQNSSAFQTAWGQAAQATRGWPGALTKGATSGENRCTW